MQTHSFRPGSTPLPDRPRVGGRYVLEQAIAEGGMGRVYQAVDEHTGQQLALKRLLDPKDPQACALFEREFRTLASLRHPRIIHVFDYVIDEHGPFYTMELVQGRDLHALAPVPFRAACRYLRDVATSLALLHTRRLLHRDITARNVRITPEGRCKLLDFGALTSFGVPERIVGTPPFIPPEAVHGAPLDQRADLFAWGALAYWVLTRQHAYPAREVKGLPQVWRQRPQPLTELVPDIPPRISDLILRLLDVDPRVRPGTVAEVIERITMLAELELEDPETVHALAESYLVHAPLVARDAPMQSLQQAVERTGSGEGSALWVQGPAGSGRTRLLQELVVQAKLAGMRCVAIDAGMHRQPQGTAVALLLQVVELSPEALDVARTHAAQLSGLDEKVAQRLEARASQPAGAVSGDWRGQVQEALHEVVSAACRAQRLLITVDNADEADEGSLALLAALARLVRKRPLMLVCSVRWESGDSLTLAARVLRRHSKLVELPPFASEQTQELFRSLFGQSPNLARFAEWAHAATAGIPLHLMELVRDLFERGDLRFDQTLWVVPKERPTGDLGQGLDAMFLRRVDRLSIEAKRLVEVLALQRNLESREQCLALADSDAESPGSALDELVAADVLHESEAGYRFSHALMRDVLIEHMDPQRRRTLHVRSGERVLREAGESGLFAQIEAGWHFLQAGEETRGADLLSSVAYDTVGIRFAFADLQVVAPALEAALQIYERQGRGDYERLPLTSALAQAGYYEDRTWGERYGDQALALLERSTGLVLARKLRRWMGKTPSLLVGLGVAWVRFLVGRRRKTYSFWSMMVQLFGVVTTLTGAAALALDGKRAARLASVLEPFAHLPERLTPVGIWQFCDSLKEIARENLASAIQVWERLIERFHDPRYYPTLPESGRALYLGGLWFARGVFECFRDGHGALRAADELDRIGLKLYRMIASQLRALHYATRGELSEARAHREHVELHAIQVGSAWQAELWDPCAQILVYTTLQDPVELRRVANRIRENAGSVPSMALYQLLVELSTQFVKVDEASFARLEEIIEAHPPRGFIGWASVHGYAAELHNRLGRFEDARRVAERALAHLSTADREFVTLFLNVEIQHALALAGLGRVDDAIAELEALCARHAESDNPLTRGQLHEALARLAAIQRDWERFDAHLQEVRRLYQGTGTSALVARAEALAVLQPTRTAQVSDRQLAEVKRLAAQAAAGDGQALLAWVNDHSGAPQSLLFVMDGQQVRLQAATGVASDFEPSAALLAEIQQCLGAAAPRGTASGGAAAEDPSVSVTGSVSETGATAVREQSSDYLICALTAAGRVAGALVLGASSSEGTEGTAAADTAEANTTAVTGVDTESAARTRKHTPHPAVEVGDPRSTRLRTPNAAVLHSIASGLLE